jgi:hypothetical protein
MTGNTTSVLIGMGILVLVLPVGLLILFVSNRTIERAHPTDDTGTATGAARSGPQVASGRAATASVPGPRPAHADEAGARRTQASH